MAHEHGLPSVPRGLPRELTIFLQGILRVLSSMGGFGRGTEKTRALRVSDGKTVAAPAALGAGAVATRHINDGAVTQSKLADLCVTEGKLAQSSVTAFAIAGGAVTGEALAAQCVSADKLADNALPASMEGSARDGEAVQIGKWYGAPHVALLGFRVPLMDGATHLRAGIKNLREEAGVWRFDAVAHMSDGEETEAQAERQGEISWRASGIRRVADAK
ncbi:hypothetical protein [Desulfovibrio sp. ZJ200]|uniref:hypothetical protein n=1 Tax=Desulfovibrio sp. ZJ200 TaxID=2709792 RepID=UPI00197DE090|nr:hypothetical protein [Desulfovibrio sp. ZJ200]